MCALEVNQPQLLEHLKSRFGESSKIAGIVCYTPFYLNQDNGSEPEPFYNYEFENCKVVWVNPLILGKATKSFSCVRIFVSGNRRHNELLVVARHFAGLFSYLNEVITLIEAGRMTGNMNERLDFLEKSQGDFILDKYVYLSQGANIGDFLDVACNPHYPIDNEGLLALSHIFEASSSFNQYWTYICYWKVLEILYGRVRSGPGGSVLRNYINNNAPLNFNQQDWMTRYPNTFGRLYGTRNSVSHWQNDRAPSIKDPADERLRARVEEDTHILWRFVRYGLNPKYGLRAF